MRLTTHFWLDELLKSDTAARLGIAEQFDPPAAIIENLTTLAKQLEVVRAILGSTPILISSGYRCERVNDAVPGSSRESAHLQGLAADFIAPSFDTPAAICRRLNTARNLEFDQVIYEYGRWVHFGLRPQMRKQVLSKFVGDPVYHAGVLEIPSTKEIA